MSADCVFCDRIEASDYLGHKRRVVSFEPLNPVVGGHRLFLHQTHTRDAATEPWITAQVVEIASDWAREYGGAFNLITSAGTEATQTIRHLHVHFVPRCRDDGLLLPWSAGGSATPADQPEQDEQR